MMDSVAFRMTFNGHWPRFFFERGATENLILTQTHTHGGQPSVSVSSGVEETEME